MEIWIIPDSAQKRKKLKIEPLFIQGDPVEQLVSVINDEKELGVIYDMRLNMTSFTFEYWAVFLTKSGWFQEHELVEFEIPEEKKIGFLKEQTQTEDNGISS